MREIDQMADFVIRDKSSIIGLYLGQLKDFIQS